MLQNLKLVTFSIIIFLTATVNFVALAFSTHSNQQNSLLSDRRKPASISSITLDPTIEKAATPSKTQEVSWMQETEMDCYTAPTILRMSAQYVMFKFRPCYNEDQPLSHTQLTNLTNHLRATVFKKNETEWVSDYVYMNEGLNHIQISESFDSGKTISRTYKILNRKKSLTLAQ